MCAPVQRSDLTLKEGVIGVTIAAAITLLVIGILAGEGVYGGATNAFFYGAGMIFTSFILFTCVAVKTCCASQPVD